MPAKPKGRRKDRLNGKAEQMDAKQAEFAAIVRKTLENVAKAARQLEQAGAQPAP